MKISEQKIKEIVGILIQAAHPVRIFLFGSYARGKVNENSDIDFLVVEKNLENRSAEMVRLRRSVSPLRLPVDIIVVSERNLKEWSDTPGNLYYEVTAEGKLLYEAS